jgi:Ser-tRNA(Ala) deacylase AlaX
MTKRLFWEDPYQREFSSSIEKIEGNRVVLESTCFYPESGGQIGDTGFLNDVRVIDTQYGSSRKTIYHITGNVSDLNIEQPVHGKIDWHRRYKIMKNHSALHIVYYAFLEKHGLHKVIGSQVRDDRARVDFKYHGEVDVNFIETRTNEIVQSNLEIRCYASKEDENYRFWEINGFERMPDGAVHPANTSEIGYVTVTRKSLGKQGIRIYVTTHEGE